MITSGEGRYKIYLERKDLSNDILLVMRGGEKPHIGSVVICENEKISESIKFGEHKDYIVLEPIALAAAKKYKRKVVAIGGIHIEAASKDEIELIIKNCKELEKCI